MSAPAGGPYRCIVVGTDGSDTATAAVEHAARLAQACAARLLVVTAFTVQPEDPTAPRVPDDVRWQLSDRNLAEERARAGRARARQLGVNEVTVVAEEGEADEVILDTARREDADLVVVGSKGMTSARRFVLGSVANRISHHAPCDLLIAHTGA